MASNLIAGLQPPPTYTNGPNLAMAPDSWPPTSSNLAMASNLIAGLQPTTDGPNLAMASNPLAGLQPPPTY